jgi:hypothetical protein
VPASDRAVAAREIRVESQADGTFLAVHADTGARELLPTYRLLADHLHATAWQGTSPVEVVLVGWESHKAAAIEGMMRGRPRSDRAPIHVLSSSREVAGGPIEEPRLTLGAAVRTVSASTRDVTIEIPTGQGVSTMHVTAESGEIAPAEVEPIRGVVESTIREGQKDGITPRQLQEKTRTNLKKLDRKYNVDEHHKAQGLDFYHGARDTVRHDAAA